MPFVFDFECAQENKNSVRYSLTEKSNKLRKKGRRHSWPDRGKDIDLFHLHSEVSRLPLCKNTSSGQKFVLGEGKNANE